MSKSDVGGYINLKDNIDVIRKRLASAPTDAGQGDVVPAEGGVANLLTLVELFQGKEARIEFEKQYVNDGIKYQDLKEELATSIYSLLEPIQEKRKGLEQDRAYVDDVIADGAAKARLIASRTVSEVKKKMGLVVKIKPTHKPVISIEDFAKLDIRVGTVVEATVPEGSDKLIRTVIDFGEDVGKRMVFSGIKEFYAPEDLVGRQLAYVLNLVPRKMMDEESQGMLVAAAPTTEKGKRTAGLFAIDNKVQNGTLVI